MAWFLRWLVISEPNLRPFFVCFFVDLRLPIDFWFGLAGAGGFSSPPQIALSWLGFFSSPPGLVWGLQPTSDCPWPSKIFSDCSGATARPTPGETANRLSEDSALQDSRADWEKSATQCTDLALVPKKGKRRLFEPGGFGFPFFSTIVLSKKKRPVSLGFRRFSGKTDPWKEWTWKVPLENQVWFPFTYRPGGPNSQRASLKLSRLCFVGAHGTRAPGSRTAGDGSISLGKHLSVSECFVSG